MFALVLLPQGSRAEAQKSDMTIQVAELREIDWVRFTTNVFASQGQEHDIRYELWAERKEKRLGYHNFALVRLERTGEVVDFQPLVHYCLRVTPMVCPLFHAGKVIDLTETFPPDIWLPQHSQPNEAQVARFIGENISANFDHFSSICDVDYIVFDFLELWGPDPQISNRDDFTVFFEGSRVWTNTKDNCA